MPQEIERKFLVTDDSWRADATGQTYYQGYIVTTAPGQSVRIRIAGNRAYLTIKGPATGLSRAEFEYEIPTDDAQEMLNTLCDRPFIEKIRYRLPIGSVVWEIDEFKGENAGLIVAEVELETAEQFFERPAWLGREVSGEVRYYNASLVRNPFSRWEREEMGDGEWGMGS